ncbi:MAG: hypothetical protein M3Q95_11995 [Bacteroidota bacterium]|nr:hypothetical protein [Bacteroidota bacterium]
MKPIPFITAASISLMCISGTVYSQNVVPGITAGASLNTMDLHIDTFSTELSDINGVEVGFYVNFSAGLIYVRPMAVASYLKGSVITKVDGVENNASKFKLTTLETPVLIGLKLLPGISFEAGPSWNYIISYTDKVGEANIDLTRHALGYRAGLRASFARLGAFGHYGGIVNVDDSDNNYELNRPSRIVFGVTFNLISRK